MEKSIRIVSYIVGFILVAVLVQTLTATKFAGLKEKNGYYSRDVVSIKTREQQLDCLAINIYREAGYEPFEGKVAVAQVTLNRVQAGVFGKDVCGVVYQKNVIMEKAANTYRAELTKARRNSSFGARFREDLHRFIF